MERLPIVLCLCASSIQLVACGGNSGGGSSSSHGAPSKDGTTHELTPKSPATTDVVYTVPAQTIDPGTEKLFCTYLAPLEQQLVVTGFATTQARGGHHMVLYRALAQKPEGTVEDCSTGESMKNLMLALTQTGTQEPGASAIDFPPGNVVVLEPGTQFVTQSHYINTSDSPLVSNDTMTIHTTSADPSSLTILNLFVASQIDFEIPANTEGYSARAGCTLDRDLKFLSLAPHMHEWGTRIDFSIGTAAPLDSILSVSGWNAAMRDLPPITAFDKPDSGHFTTGDSVELQCTWNNTETHSIAFPNEMCAVVGYFTSDASGNVMCIDTLQ